MGTLAAAIHATVYRGGGDPSLLLDAPFAASIYPAKAVTPSSVFTRNALATFRDANSVLRNCYGSWPSNIRTFAVPRFTGTRLIRNHFHGCLSDQDWAYHAGAYFTLVEDNTWFVDLNACALSNGIYTNTSVGVRLFGIDSNQKLAFSFEARSDTPGDIALGEPRGNGGWIEAGLGAVCLVPITSEWKRYSATLTTVFTSNSVLGVWFRKHAAVGACNSFYVRNLQLEDVTGNSTNAPSEVVAWDKATGPELYDESYDGGGVGSWLPYGANIVENDGGAIKVTYVDQAPGGYVNLTAAGGLSANLENGGWYVLAADVKVNSGAGVALNVWNGTSGRNLVNSITHTDWRRVATVFQRDIAGAGTASLGFGGMGAGEIAWIKNLSVKKIDVPTGIVGIKYSGKENATTVSSFVVSEASGADLTSQGLLFEPTCANVQTKSANFTPDASAWSEFDTPDPIVTASAAVAPTGRLEATYLGRDANPGQARIYGSLYAKPASVQPWTASLFVKANTCSWVYIDVRNSTGANRVGQWFDITNKSYGTTEVAGAWTYLTKSYEDWSNGWIRLQISATTDAVAENIRMAIFASDGNLDSALDANEGIYIFGAQLENHPFATSYIPTDGSVSTRVQEEFYFPGLTSINLSEGSLEVDITVHSDSVATPGAGAMIGNVSSARILYDHATADRFASYDGTTLTEIDVGARIGGIPGGFGAKLSWTAVGNQRHLGLKGNPGGLGVVTTAHVAFSGLTNFILGANSSGTSACIFSLKNLKTYNGPKGSAWCLLP